MTFEWLPESTLCPSLSLSFTINVSGGQHQPAHCGNPSHHNHDLGTNIGWLVIGCDQRLPEAYKLQDDDMTENKKYKFHYLFPRLRLSYIQIFILLTPAPWTDGTEEFNGHKQNDQTMEMTHIIHIICTTAENWNGQMVPVQYHFQEQ